MIWHGGTMIWHGVEFPNTWVSYPPREGTYVSSSDSVQHKGNEFIFTVRHFKYIVEGPSFNVTASRINAPVWEGIAPAKKSDAKSFYTAEEALAWCMEIILWGEL